MEDPDGGGGRLLACEAHWPLLKASLEAYGVRVSACYCWECVAALVGPL